MRKYLWWSQNSVFEGWLTGAGLRNLQQELERVIDPQYDSVLLFQIPVPRAVRRTELGVQKGGPSCFL
ncbi:MAG: CRISPR-associated endonuclease Cas2 [Calditerricola sp.]|nr:CRISPR-associated endonuclease Cas2 [Calditerricola sp.]